MRKRSYTSAGPPGDSSGFPSYDKTFIARQTVPEFQPRSHRMEVSSAWPFSELRRCRSGGKILLRLRLLSSVRRSPSSRNRRRFWRGVGAKCDSGETSLADLHKILQSAFGPSLTIIPYHCNLSLPLINPSRNTQKADLYLVASLIYGPSPAIVGENLSPWESEGEDGP
jgi:hypothetical protein